MKDLLIILTLSLTVIVVLGFGAFLIYHQKDGWGWYLFTSILILGSIKVTYD